MVWTKDDKHFFYNPSINQSTWNVPVDLVDRQDVHEWMQKGPPVTYEGVFVYPNGYYIISIIALFPQCTSK